MSAIRPVILSGGSGTRLWPLSSSELPKQFLEIFEGGSLFAQTLARGTDIGAGPAIVVAGVNHHEAVQEVVGGGDTVILEPAPRNTAPAVVAAAMQLDDDDIALVMPSDHIITDGEAFRSALATACELASEGRIVTFGIMPTRAETGYGWIEQGPSRGDGFDIARFVEKPIEALATEMLGSGGYLWNSGMFVSRAATLIGATEESAPEVVSVVRAAMVSPSEGVIRLSEEFSNAPALSFDAAVMEKTERGSVVPMSAGWSDVGSWEVIWDLADKDQMGNVVDGSAVVRDTSNSLVRATDRPVAVVGLDGVVVVSTPEGVLVIAKDRAQDVRKVVEELKERRGAEK